MSYRSSSVAAPELINAAARWLIEHWHVAPQPITRTLRQHFGFNFVDAAKAMAEAERLHRGGADGN